MGVVVISPSSGEARLGAARTGAPRMPRGRSPGGATCGWWNRAAEVGGELKQAAVQGEGAGAGAGRALRLT